MNLGLCWSAKALQEFPGFDTELWLILFWKRALERIIGLTAVMEETMHWNYLILPFPPFQVCLHRKQLLCHPKEVPHAGVCCDGIFSFKGLSCHFL